MVGAAKVFVEGPQRREKVGQSFVLLSLASPDDQARDMHEQGDRLNCSVAGNTRRRACVEDISRHVSVAVCRAPSSQLRRHVRLID